MTKCINQYGGFMNIGYFGIGILHSKNEENLGLLWRSAFNLGADFIFTIGKRYTYQCSDSQKSYKSIPLFHYLDYDDFYKHIPLDCRVVAVELHDDAKDLKEYVHPDRCIYLLGAEDHGIPEEILSKCKDIIRIDTNRCMNVAITGAIVMYDRKIKR
jgi:tRNA G18 (ribose-2'-O)-methylase SpoU